MEEREALTAFVSAFIDELTRVNVRNAVISPGSRSTPFALLMEEHPEMKTWINIDERSAGFFALGMAKASRQPVALVCTSGTAAANYMPAVVEAYLTNVPLLILTADRPHELRDNGAPQAIDQLNLYGKYTRWFMEMPIPENNESIIRYVRTIAGRAASVASGALAGPVHLNFPFREPLIPNFSSQSLWVGRNNEKEFVKVTEGKAQLSAEFILHFSRELESKRNGIIVCGPQDDPELLTSITELAEALQYPIIADPLSQLRSGHHSKENIIEGYDAFLRSDKIKSKLAPEIIIRFGAMPVSKSYMLYTQMHPHIRHVIIDESKNWKDPTSLSTDMIHTNGTEFCKQLLRYLSHPNDTAWLDTWKKLNETTKNTLVSHRSDELFEGQVVYELLNIIPSSSALFVGNSMPIRDLDTFMLKTDEKQVRVLANRGANGIDGIVSSALGASTMEERLVLIIGDLSFYHDLNGLLVSKMHELNITIIVINNDGGGIFSFLPQAKEDKHFEKLFGTPTGLDFEHVVKMYNGTFSRVTSWYEFNDSVSLGIKNKGLHVIEVKTEREANAKKHRQMWDDVLKSVEEVIKEL